MITIVNYNAGNIKSIKNMLKKLGYEALISQKAEDIDKAEKLILPGVGSFDYGILQIKELGLWDSISNKIKEGIPIMGICLGAQVLGCSSQEGKEKGFNVFDMDIVKFDISRLENFQRIPHMGWNNIKMAKESKLIKEMDDEKRYYFVHSYHFKVNENSCVAANCKYGYEFPCFLEKDNIFAIQFHPEKSHKYGMEIMKNFASL